MKPNWPTKKLGELCEIKIGKTPRRGVFKYWASGTLPWVKIAEVRGAEITNTNEQITETAAKELNMSPFPKGTVLYTFKLSIGRVGIAGVDLFTNEAIAGFLIKDRKELMPEWLFYVLPLIDYKPFLSNAVKGNTLNKSSLKLLPIPLPPLSIQKQIVERVDKIAEAQKLNDELIKKADELFQSLLHKELDPTGKNWEVKKLEEIFERITESILPTKHPDREFNYIGLENIGSNTGQIVGAGPTKGKLIKSTKIVFRKNDVLYGKLRPYLNKVWLADADGICSTDIWALRAKQNVVLSLLLSAILRQPQIVTKSSASMAGANLPRANKTVFDNIKISLPSLEIQKQIVAKLSAAQEYKKQLLEQKIRLKELFDSVLYKSMNGEMES